MQGIPLALFVLLQDDRFILLDAFIRFLANALLAPCSPLPRSGCHRVSYGLAATSRTGRSMKRCSRIRGVSAAHILRAASSQRAKVAHSRRISQADVDKALEELRAGSARIGTEEITCRGPRSDSRSS